MKEKMARKAQTAAPTSLLMGFGAFFAVLELLLAAVWLFLAVPPLFLAVPEEPELLRLPVGNSPWCQSFQKMRLKIIVSTPAPQQ